MASLPKTYAHITLASRPKAAIDPNLLTGTFKLDTHVPLRLDDVKKDQVLVKVEWLSLDPAMRGQSRLRSYAIDSGKVGALCLTGLGVCEDLFTCSHLIPERETLEPSGSREIRIESA